jgi:hypothetical protein
MRDRDWDDEDWCDEDDDASDEEESASCPECGGTVYSFSDKCPKCGYWLTDADRRAVYPSASKPLWLRITAVVVLLAFLASLLLASGFLF